MKLMFIYIDAKNTKNVAWTSRKILFSNEQNF